MTLQGRREVTPTGSPSTRIVAQVTWLVMLHTPAKSANPLPTTSMQEKKRKCGAGPTDSIKRGAAEEEFVGNFRWILFLVAGR